jgi:hypothetical protein
MILKDIISHVRDRNYLGEIDRNYLRVKATGEVFTPLIIITKKLNDLESYDPNIFKDVTKTFLEPSCGDGNFLSEVLIRKIENGSTFEQALSTIYGVDLMQDNVDLCRDRLLCGREDLRHIVEQNIYQADALKFSYKFEPMSNTRRAREDRLRKQAQKAAEQARIKAEQQERYDRHFKDAPKKKVKNVV